MEKENGYELPLIYEEMPIVLVRNGLRAAIGRGNDSEGVDAFVDALTRVEIKFADSAHNFSHRCTVSLWWEVGEGQSFVYEKTILIDTSTVANTGIYMLEFWEEVSSFTTEEIIMLKVRLSP